MSDALLDRPTLAPPGIAIPRNRLKRIAAVTAILGALVAAGSFGHHWWISGRFIESTDDAYVGGDVTPIAPHVAGFIAEVAIGDDQRVRAGQLLIRLDRRDYQAALDHAAASVAERGAALEELRARYAMQQSTIREREADVAARTARAAFAGQDAERYRGLAVTSAGSRQDAERSATLYREATAGLASAKAALDAASQQLKVLDAQVAAAEAAEAEARSDLETARLNLGYTEIRAPIDGYVANRAARAGSYVAPGAYLLSIIPASGLWVDANFKEDQLAPMKPGQSATVAADILPGQPFHGHVVSLAHGAGAVFSVIPAENATGNFTKIVQRVPVRIALDAGQAGLEMLRPGLSITARVDARPDPDIAP
jgi:membrane fusion protein (multidrug efflux system)